MCVLLATGEPGTFNLHNYTWAGIVQKTVALLYLLLVALFQCSVCGTNGLQRVATRIIDLLPSFVI